MSVLPARQAFDAWAGVDGGGHKVDCALDGEQKGLGPAEHSTKHASRLPSCDRNSGRRLAMEIGMRLERS